MSLKSYAIATALSLLLWGAAYYAVIASYQFVQHAGMLPGLMIRVTLATLIG